MIGKAHRHRDVDDEVLVSDDLRLEALRAKIREQAPEAEQAAMTIAEQMRREG